MKKPVILRGTIPPWLARPGASDGEGHYGSSLGGGSGFGACLGGIFGDGNGDGRYGIGYGDSRGFGDIFGAGDGGDGSGTGREWTEEQDP